MRLRGRSLILSAILFLTLILLMSGCAASTGETPVVRQAASTTSPADDICPPEPEAPCGPEDSNGDQETAPASAPTNGTVRAVLLWMEGCPHCETVKNTVLPPLEAEYGDKLEILRVEVEGLQAVDKLYLLGERLGIPKDEVGVPLLLMGDRALSGEYLIRNQLPLLIQIELARGGVDFPAVPEFDIFPGGSPAAAQPVPTSKRAAIYLFWGDGCPHCAVAKPFLQSLDQNSEQVELHAFEVYYVAENKVLFLEMAEAFGFAPHSVPTIFIGDQYWEGYSDQIKNEIQAAVDACLLNGCPDAGHGILPEGDAFEVVPETFIAGVGAGDQGENSDKFPGNNND